MASYPFIKPKSAMTNPESNNEENPLPEGSSLLHGALLESRIPLYTSKLERRSELTFEERHNVSSPLEVALLLGKYLYNEDREEFLVILLDSAGTVIGIGEISIGGLASTVVEPRSVFKVAILSNAASIIAVHNHISGNPEPSKEDIRISKLLVEAGNIMGIPVRDHIIITEKTFTSLAEKGLL